MSCLTVFCFVTCLVYINVLVSLWISLSLRLVSLHECIWISLSLRLVYIRYGLTAPEPLRQAVAAKVPPPLPVEGTASAVQGALTKSIFQPV